jgi:RNA exonuclease NGL2
MLHAEILSHDADILCMQVRKSNNAPCTRSNEFQEVDKLDKLLPALDLAEYAYYYATGADKPHGCLIAYKNTIFRSIHEATIEYDRLEAHSNPELSTQARIGSSHRTKNIANIVALQSIDPESDVQGYIIATTHLFWHPAFVHDYISQQLR